MRQAAARDKSSEVTRTLYVAFELAWKQWKLALSPGLGQRPRLVHVPAGSLAEALAEIRQAKEKFGLEASVPVVSCYEAGRDGFWLDRWLASKGIKNLVVDAASIGVRRQRRRRKTDRLDATNLVTLLARYCEGERSVWSVVAVPSEEEEDRRHQVRELQELKKDRTRQINRMKGLLANQGLRLEPASSRFLEELKTARLWNGHPVAPGLQARLSRAYQRLQWIQAQKEHIQQERQRQLEESNAECVEKVRQLLLLRGVGIESAWLLTMELFAWRQYRNRKQVASLVGLTPTPYASGQSSRELGISKTGNRWVRAILIEVAWSWLRNQPESELSQWYEKRFADGGSRRRRIGIVAVARKLLIDLWRYVEFGIVPEGAVFSH